MYLLLAYIIFMSVLSFYVVLDNASKEPYYSLKLFDAILQIGVGTTLIVLWAQLAIFISYGIYSKKLSYLWSLLFIWFGFVGFYVAHCPRYYISDILKFALKLEH